MSRGCPVCLELLRQAREEAEGPRSLQPAALAVELLALAVAAVGSFVVAGALTLTALGEEAPRVPVVVVTCDEQGLCSTLLPAGVVAAGVAGEE